MSTRLCFLLFPLFLLYGCAKINEELMSRTASAECATCENEALASGQFIKSEWPKKTWWEDFNDPQLNQLIQTSLESSPTLLSAEERLKAAFQASKVQKGYLFPSLSLAGDDNWQHFGKNSFYRSLAPTVPPVINQIDLDLNFAYEFDFWGKNRALYKAALDEAYSAKAERDQSELILTTSIAYAYFQYQLAEKKLELLTKIAHNHEQLIALTKARFIHAIDYDVQVNETMQAYWEAAKLISMSETDRELAAEKIKAVSGMGQDSQLTVSPPLPFANTKIALPSHLSLDLLARRPDLEAQLWLVEKSAQEIHVAKTAFYPDFNLLAFVGLESLHFNNFFTRQSAMAALNPAFNLPIFTGGRLTAQLQAKAAAFNEAVQTYNALVLQAAQEVAMQLTQIIQLQKQAELQTKIVETSMYNTMIAEQRFAHALDSLLMVLHRSNEQLQEEIALVELEYSRRLASILLVRALGGGYSYD